MKIRNANPRALEIGATGQQVEPGEEVDVDDELGAALVSQPSNWVPVGVQGPDAEPKSKRGRAAESDEETG